jgi:hypothetical protein
MPSADPYAGGIKDMPNLITVALITVGLGFLLAVPCIVETTPITMCLFFFLGIPLFAIGFLSYIAAVVQDLRRHEVL